MNKPHHPIPTTPAYYLGRPIAMWRTALDRRRLAPGRDGDAAGTKT
jgi:hypothetical protein